MITSQKFINKVTGKIETNIPLSKMRFYDKYDGDEKVGEYTNLNEKDMNSLYPERRKIMMDRDIQIARKCTGYVGGYTLSERLDLTLENIKFQNNEAYFDDIEKLKMLLQQLKDCGF